MTRSGSNSFARGALTAALWTCVACKGDGSADPSLTGGPGGGSVGVQTNGSTASTGGTNAGDAGGPGSASGQSGPGTNGENATGSSGEPGTKTDAGGRGTGDAAVPDPGPGSQAGSDDVAIDPTPGRWRTGLDPETGRMAFISPDGVPTVMRGVSMTGLETGTRGTASGGGFWLFNAAEGDEPTGAPQVLENVIDVLTHEWQSDVVRIPICGSAWTQDYLVHDWGGAQIAGYKDWVDRAVQKARADGKVVILDLHLWAIAKMSRGTEVDRGTFTRDGQTYQYEDWEDGCTGDNNVMGVDSCAPEDWFTGDRMQWECAIANADGVTLHNAHKNREHIRDMWIDVAQRYKGDSAVWFELFNEPYTRKATGPYPEVGANEEEHEYPWDLWAELMHMWIEGIRSQAGAPNIVIVNGLDWGYSFGPRYGPIHDPKRYLPWLSEYPNIAYGFHPYQHGACCGQIGTSTNESLSDPYQSAYCTYYPNGESWGEPSGAPLPGGASCIQKGYAETQDKKSPPCHWVAEAFNPSTQQNGLCAGDRSACSALTREQCEQLDWSTPEAGGWSRYVLPMNAYGPLIATEFGSFDCSSPFVTTFLKYMRELNISYTAWALWPQNSGGPGGLGACGYPSVMTSSADGDFRECRDRQACANLIQPLPWAGREVHRDLTTP